MTSPKEIVASLTELDVEALKGTMGAWDPETCERLRQFKLGDGSGDDFHITDLGQTVLVLKIAASLSESQAWLIRVTESRWSDRFDMAGYGAGVFNTARSLVRRELMVSTTGGDDISGGEVRLTDLGRAVAAELRQKNV